MRFERTMGTVLFLAAVVLLPACGSDDGGGAPAATATATVAPTVPATSTATTQANTPVATATATEPQATLVATATATPVAGEAAVNGLVVVRGDVRASGGDALDAAPAESAPDGFERGLSHASWKVGGEVTRSGETAADGSFRIADLPPGAYDLELLRTLNGDLIQVTVPMTVGPDGATLVVEIAPGLVRWSNTYERDGQVVRETGSPSGTRLVTRDGVIVEIAAPGRRYVDADGDGSFEPEVCETAPAIWLCNENRDCGEDRVCACVSSCPDCEDCPASACVPAGATSAYSCSASGGCQNPGDRCACVSSCEFCDDCAAAACVPSVPSCTQVSIEAIDAYGPSRLFPGQTGAMSAVARLSDGWVIDVTHLVGWASSDTSVITVDAWGVVMALDIGSATVQATLGALASEPWAIEAGSKPALRRIHLQNVSCYYPSERPAVGPDGTAPPSVPDQAILPPVCRQVVRVGGTMQFSALGEFDDGYYEDVTSQVDWDLAPSDIGEMSNGVFTGIAVGTVTLSAHIGEVTSEPTEIRVVDRPTIVELQIFPITALPRPDGTVPPQWFGEDHILPCYHCGYAVTILIGDELPFHATAAYDTGDWEDVTNRVTWTSSNPSVASMTGFLLHALGAGEVTVTATLEDATSNEVGVNVVESATLQGLSVYQDGLDRVVRKGEEALFHALGYYDVGFSRDVTGQATWKSSDESIGGFLVPGVFIGRAAGTVDVWAELDGTESNRESIQVFETSSLDYCDENSVNRATWTDSFNRVLLETDCVFYDHPEVASIRFTVTERERPFGIFDPCLDLHVYQGSRLVRTIREQGCGEPFLAPGSPEFDDAVLRYQTLAFWDLKDDAGAPVAAGTYTILGRFYLYYDPIVQLNVVVGAPSERIPCQQNDCGNGCGYVHSCGGTPPMICPTVCTSICECPGGWGITDAGDCEPCS